MTQHMTQLNRTTRLFVRVFGVVSGIVFLGVTLFVALFYAAMPLNTLSLWRMERALVSSVRHPADSHTIESRSFLGSRYINSFECTFVAGEFRSTSLSRKELMAAYDGDTVRIFGFARRMPVNVVIADNNARLPLDEPANDWLNDFTERIDTSAGNTTYYLVYLYEKDRSPWGDNRCDEVVEIMGNNDLDEDAAERVVDIMNELGVDEASKGLWPSREFANSAVEL